MCSFVNVNKQTMFGLNMQVAALKLNFRKYPAIHTHYS